MPDAARRRCPRSPKTSLAISPMPPSEPISDDASIGISTTLLLRRRADLGQRLGVFLGDEVVDRLDVALGDRLRHHLRGARLGFGGALARLGVAEGGLAPAFGLAAPARCLAGPSASRIWARLSRSAFICRAIDSTRLAGGLMSLISTRVTLMPQGCAASSTTRSRRSLMSSRLDSNSSRSIEPITVRMLVMVRLRMAFCRPGDLIGCLRRVQHLVEGDAVDRDDGVVAGDDLLGRHVEHLLHHVHLGADAVDEGDDQVEAGRQRPGVAAETLDGVVVALRDGLDAGEQHAEEQGRLGSE